MTTSALDPHQHSGFQFPCMSAIFPFLYGVRHNALKEQAVKHFETQYSICTVIAKAHSSTRPATVCFGKQAGQLALSGLLLAESSDVGERRFALEHGSHHQSLSTIQCPTRPL